MLSNLAPLHNFNEIQVRKVLVAVVLPLSVALLLLEQVPHVDTDERPWMKNMEKWTNEVDISKEYRASAC